MPFVKLDCEILTSSLWPDGPDDQDGRDDRDIFLTALLMATPHELRDPAPQLATESLDPTGWAVPPGWYGLVRAVGRKIAQTAGVLPDRAVAALQRLAMADLESRSKAFDGRRLVRVDGGFIVLNFQAYRDRDHTNADRQRRYRNGRNAVTSLPVTQAEAEAEADLLFPVPDEYVHQNQASIENVQSLWNEIVTAPIPKVTKLTETRRTKIRRCLKEVPALDDWRKAITFINGQPWCRGQNSNPKHAKWVASFDWFTRHPETVLKYLEQAQSAVTRPMSAKESQELYRRTALEDMPLDVYIPPEMR